MDRRHFLTLVGAGSVPAVSGCLGYELTSSEELESKDDEIADLEAEISDLEDELEGRDADVEELETEVDEYEAEIADLEDEIADLEDEVEQRDGDIEDLEEELEDRRAELTELVEARLVSLYEAAYDGYELAEDEFDRAVEVAEREEYAAAIANFGSALGHYNATTSFTYRVVTLAEDRDEDAYAEAIELATDANIHAQYMTEAADAYSLASQYFANGDSSQGERAANDGEAALEEARAHDFTSLEEFRASL